MDWEEGDEESVKAMKFMEDCPPATQPHIQLPLVITGLSCHGTINKLKKKLLPIFAVLSLSSEDKEIFSGMRTMPVNNTRKYIKLVFLWGMEKALFINITPGKKAGRVCLYVSLHHFEIFLVFLLKLY